jgi:hypothetical protein
MNGAPLGQRFKRASAYVAQEDVFVPTLSAERGTPKADIKQRMVDVLTVMGLWRVRNTQASGPSDAYLCGHAIMFDASLPSRVTLFTEHRQACSEVPALRLPHLWCMLSIQVPCMYIASWLKLVFLCKRQ